MAHDVGSSGAQTRGPATILVAEDHHGSREALRILLESAGYRVAVAVDGRGALAAALAHPPDLVVTDLMMPGLDGIELARRLRSHDATEAVPIIGVTALQETREAALAAGVDAVMMKPIDIRALLAVVRERLGRKEGG